MAVEHAVGNFLWSLVYEEQAACCVFGRLTREHTLLNDVERDAAARYADDESRHATWYRTLARQHVSRPSADLPNPLTALGLATVPIMRAVYTVHAIERVFRWGSQQIQVAMQIQSYDEIAGVIARVMVDEHAHIAFGQRILRSWYHGDGKAELDLMRRGRVLHEQRRHLYHFGQALKDATNVYH